MINNSRIWRSSKKTKTKTLTVDNCDFVLQLARDLHERKQKYLYPNIVWNWLLFFCSKAALATKDARFPNYTRCRCHGQFSLASNKYIFCFIQPWCSLFRPFVHTDETQMACWSPRSFSFRLRDASTIARGRLELDVFLHTLYSWNAYTMCARVCVYAQVCTDGSIAYLGYISRAEYRE